MIITISGMPGSGKSTVAKILAKKLGMKRYYIGGMRREIARKKGMTLEQLNDIGEKEDWTDKEVDDYQKELGKREDNFIIEGRTSFFLIPNSIKVFLDVDFETGVKRIFEEISENATERNEGKFSTLDEAKNAIKKRMNSDDIRYRKYYNVDIFDRAHYDIVLDTTNLTREQVVEKLIAKIKNVKN